MQKITTFLTYDDQAEAAVNFYTSIFDDSEIVSLSRNADGTFLSATFQLANQQFMALNGGPHFSFKDGISLFVHCETQAEVDDLWEKLSDGGEQGSCGWLKDQFGVSWQIIPGILGTLLQDEDPAKSNRVLQAMLKMSKIEIDGLMQAYEGK